MLSTKWWKQDVMHANDSMLAEHEAAPHNSDMQHHHSKVLPQHHSQRSAAAGRPKMKNCSPGQQHAPASYAVTGSDCPTVAGHSQLSCAVHQGLYTAKQVWLTLRNANSPPNKMAAVPPAPVLQRAVFNNSDLAECLL